jgi:hypothetical protein
VNRLALIVVLSGCGRVGFGDPHPDAVPAGFCNTATFSNAAASTLKDDFTTPYTDRWRPNNQASPCIDQVGSELVATPSNAMPEYCFAFPLADYHLTCDSVFFKVPEVTSPILRVQTVLYIESVTDSASINVLAENGGISIASTASNRQDVAYDPVLDLWWRVTERDGETTFSTAPDGVAWRDRMQVPTVLSLDHVQISIGAGTYPVVPATPGQARFRCFNVPPPCN